MRYCVDFRREGKSGVSLLYAMRMSTNFALRKLVQVRHFMRLVKNMKRVWLWRTYIAKRSMRTCRYNARSPLSRRHAGLASFYKISLRSTRTDIE